MWSDDAISPMIRDAQVRESKGDKPMLQVSERELLRGVKRIERGFDALARKIATVEAQAARQAASKTKAKASGLACRRGHCAWNYKGA